LITIPGYTVSDKVPGAVAINKWGAGKKSIGSIPLFCALYGNFGGGTAVANEDHELTTPEEADALFGARSELARMCHAALDVAGVTLRAIGVTPASGGTAATFTFDIGGSWTTSGEISFQVDEEVIRVAVAASHTPTTFGDAAEDAFNQAQDGRLFCTAVNTAGRLVLTVFDVGVRGNQHVLRIDSSLKPSGMTIAADQLSAVAQVGTGPAITVAGTDTVDGTYVVTISLGGANGTATFGVTRNAISLATGVTVPTTPFTYPIPGTSIIVTFGNGTHVIATTHTWTGVAALSNGFIPFMGGAGSDDIEDALDATDTITNDYIGLAHNDATNVGKVETHVGAKAAFDVGRLEQYVTSTNRTLAGAIAIGQTGMNDQLGQCLWVQNGVEHPSRVSARMAALRSVTEGAQPNTNYDDMVLPGAAPQAKTADVPNRSTLNSALNNSVTPLVTVDGSLLIVRSICSRSLNGATPDYRTYDTGDVSVPIRIRKELLALAAQLKSADGGGMQWDGPDPEEGLAPEGIFTPNFWAAQCNAKLQEWESPRFNWLQDVAANPAKAEWDPDAKRTMSDVPNIVRHQWHQLGAVIRQTAA
jgi:phage tail sheath gpL-like